MNPKAPLARCDECPLKDQPHVLGRGPAEAEYVIVGEAPGANEVKTGIPFIGASGKLLDRVLRFHGIDRERVYITNAVLCRPPLKDGKNTPPTAKAIHACRDRLVAEINDRNPHRVLALGGVAAKAVSGTNDGITRMRLGGPREVDDLNAPVVATFHPAFALRDPSKFPSIVADVKKLHVEINWEPTKTEVISDTIEGIRRLTEQCKRPLVALDAEWEPPFDKHSPQLRCIGISSEAGQATVYSREVVIDHNWLTTLNNMFGVTRFVMQNGKSDIQELWGAGVPNARVDEDTMLMHYATDERKGTHGLEQLATEFLGAPLYKTEAKMGADDSKMQVWELPDDKLYAYNGIDCDATLQLVPILRKDMDGDGTTGVYERTLVPGANALARMEYRGISVDEDILAQFDDTLTQRLDSLEHDLERYVANPRSPKQITEAFSLRNEEMESTDAAHLTDLILRSPETEEAHFASLLLEYRKHHKSRQTYVRGIGKRILHGKVWTDFKLHGTETGRLSSARPNMQNITQGELRGMFVASNEGGVLLNADYSAIELRVAALELDSPWLLQAFREERSIHKEVAVQLFGGSYTDRQYRDGKTVTFGIFYDRRAAAIAGQLKIPIRQAQKMIDNWKARCPELDLYFKRTQEEIRANGFLRSKYGRLRRFWLLTHDNMFDAFREGYNFKIQSPAGDITTNSLIRIDRELPELKPVITVHDSLVFDVDDARDVPEVKRAVRTIMEDTPDFDVPTPVEFKGGYRWA